MSNMSCLPNSIRVFENCPKCTIEELKQIHSLNVTKIFGDPKAVELLKCYAREYCSGSVTDQYVQLHQQIEEFIEQPKVDSTLTLDDIDDLDGLPSDLERQLRNAVTAKHDGLQQKDQTVRECLKRVQESLCNDIQTRREFVLFKLGIKKALKPHCRV